MNPLKIITHPLVAATIAVVFASSWAISYTSVNAAARLAAEQVRPWTKLAREQMNDVGACEVKSRSLAQARFPNTAHTADREILARQSAFSCAASYLLGQPRIASSVASQTLGYASGSAQRLAALGKEHPVPEQFDALFQKAAQDARLATQDAENADLALLKACQGFLAASACSVGNLMPDSPDRRMGDSMREFEIDIHAQQWIATHATEEMAYQSKTGSETFGMRGSPAYAHARETVYSSRHIATADKPVSRP